MIFLDTNIPINILRKKPRGKQWKDFLENKSIAFTTITAFELFLGAELSQSRDHNMNAVQNLVQQFPIYPFSIKSAFIAGKLYGDLQKRGEMIEINDIYIAAIVLEHNSELATDNLNHFRRIKKLRLIEI